MGHGRQQRRIDLSRKLIKYDCWEWQRGCDKDGYGQVYWKQRYQKAHRVAYVLTHGDLGSLHVLHKCDNPPCCNPRHLFKGTHQENVADMMAKGRNAHIIGEQRVQSVLTTEKAWQIRQIYLTGRCDMLTIAGKFGVAESTIHAVIHNQRWIDPTYNPPKIPRGHHAKMSNRSKK